MKHASKARPSKKRQEIIETAEHLFSRFGAKRVTIEELCREAGVSKMTFYKHFANKVALVRDIRDRWVDEGFAKFDEINALDIPFPEKIDRMTHWKVAWGARINAHFIRELISNDDILVEFKRRYLANIVSAQDQGEIRSDIDPEFLWLVIEKLNELFKDGSWKQVFSKPEEYQRQLRTLLWHGLLTRKEDA